MAIFQPKNRRIGPFLNMSLPPGPGGTCVGRTTLCCSLRYNASGTLEYSCYALRGLNKWPKTVAYRQRTYELSLTPAFVPQAIAELRKSTCKYVRPHIAGDFYSAEYVDKWRDIAMRCPDKVFWTYTRSWRVAEIRPALLRLAELDNVNLFWSADAETDRVDGVPPIVPAVRVAYLRTNATEQIPWYVDLIWRDKRQKEYPEPHTFACPQGSGSTAVNADTACNKCRWCLHTCDCTKSEFMREYTSMDEFIQEGTTVLA